MKNSALSGMLDAGNPHVLFDEGGRITPMVGRPEGVALGGAMPRRGSPLCISGKTRGMASYVLFGGFLVVNAAAARAETFYFTSTNTAGVVADGKAYLQAENWATADGTPAESAPGGDDIAIIGQKDHNGFGLGYVNLTTTAARSLGTVVGSDGLWINSSVARTSSKTQNVRITVKDPNGFKGGWTVANPRTEYVLSGGTGDGAFVPRFSVLETKNAPYLLVTNRAVVGLLKASVDRNSSVVEYAGGGSLTKRGPGTLEVEAAGGAEERIYVNAGCLELDGHPESRVAVQEILDKAWMHLDATRRDTMLGYEDAEGRYCVTNWTSVNGAPAHAWYPTSAEFQSMVRPDGMAAVNPPFVGTAKSTSGCEFMDFGSVNGGKDLGPKSCMLRFTHCEQVRELFIVRWLSDTAASYNSIIGRECESASGKRTDHPLHTDGLNELFGSNTDTGVVNGEIFVNGIRSFWWSHPSDYLTSGWGKPFLLNVAPTGPICLDVLGSERLYKARTGGCRIGEVIIFQEKLTEAERAQVNDYLMRKWFKDYEPCDVGAVVLKDGASISVPEGRVARVGRMSVFGSTLVKTGGGTLVVDELSPTNATLDIRGGAVRVNPDHRVPATDAPADKPYVWFDATDNSTLQTSVVNGVCYVTNWLDKAGGTVHATLPVGNSGYKGKMPMLLAAKSPTGLQVVDFGSGTSANTASWMWMMPHGEAHAQEAFLVLRCTSDVFGNIFDTSTMTMIMNDRVSGTTFVSSTYAGFAALAGQWTQNGAIEDPIARRTAFATGASAPFYVCSFAAPGKVIYDLMAHDRTNTTADQGVGNKQIGEILIYDRRLTPSERRNTEAYLMKRWNNARHTGTEPVRYSFSDGMERRIDAEADVLVDDVVGGGNDYVKDGAGTASLSKTVMQADAERGPSFTVRNGELAVRCDYPVQPLFRFDASVDSFGGVAETSPGITNFTSWSDADGRALTASITISGKVKTNAMLTVETFPDGIARRVADFGAAASSTASGAKFSTRQTSVREAFAVERDVSSGSSVQCLFSDTSKYPFLRGWTKKNSLIQNYDAQTSPALYGYVAVDGSPIGVLPNAYAPSAGFHLYDFAPTSAVAIGSIALDRTTTAGGLAVGEEMAFSRVLEADRRAFVSGYLLNKWFGVGTQAVFTNMLEDVTVENGATLTLGGEEQFGAMAFSVGMVSGCGTVDANGRMLIVRDGIGTSASNGLSMDADLVLSEGAILSLFALSDGSRMPVSVTGRLKLPGFASVRLAVSGRRFSGQQGFIPLIAASEGFSGKRDVGSWTMEVACDRADMAWRLEIVDDMLVATYCKPGLLLMVR